MLSLLLPVLSAGGVGVSPHCIFVGGVEIALASPEITGRDILASGECVGAGAADLAALIAVLPTGQRQYTLTCAQLAGLAARRGLRIEIRCAGEGERVKFTLQAEPPVPVGGERPQGRPASSADEVRGSGYQRSAPVGEKGDRVFGAVASGPVRIEREFELLQPAWPGRDVFARSQSGEVVVLSVPDASAEGGLR